MSFDYREFEQFRDSVAELDRRSDEFFRNFLLEMALRALARTKKETPTDTGNLKNNWTVGDGEVKGTFKVRKSGKNKGKKYFAVDHEKSKKPTIAGIRRKGDVLEIDIFNNVEYASHVENGHRRKDGSFQEGRFMCRLSLDEINKQMPARQERAFKQFVSSLGF